ncbi:cysteine desulfurase [Candidatus Peregrinibacteria bacterium]|nr:cysteine desulfurase [Candidatus Peregrinibacteria bacterium]
MKKIVNQKSKKRIYMDHAATTYLDSRVKSAMEPYWDEEFGNASSLYREGRRAKKALDIARSSISALIGAISDEIIFTGGGTEGDNMAIFGAVRTFGGLASKHIITTKIEHHAVLEPLHILEKEGVEITYLDVGEDGIVNPEDVKNALRPDTILVSIMYANNEIGTIQPIAEIAESIKTFKARNPASLYPLFHTDACQAAGYLDMNVKNLGVDLMTVNGSKMYGPKGVGFLYKRNGVKLSPLLYGGGQEKRLRSGTENIPGIIGLAKAFAIAQKEREKESARLIKLRDMFIAGILESIPKVVLNGHASKRLPNNINVSVLDIEGEGIILYLDEYGIAASTGSACTSADLEPSHVILALGRPYEFAHASLRFTLGRRNTKTDIKYALSVLPDIVRILRGISPLKVKVNAKGVSHPEAFTGTVTKNSYK